MARRGHNTLVKNGVDSPAPLEPIESEREKKKTREARAKSVAPAAPLPTRGFPPRADCTGGGVTSLIVRMTT